MRKISLIAVAAVVILAGVGGWLASTTHARVQAPLAVGGIDPLQITINARDLPTEHIVDYSFIYS
jgi:hypothetical protein